MVPNAAGKLGGNENPDLVSLRRDLEQVLASEIAKNEVALRIEPDGLVISLREIGFFESGSSSIRETSLSTLGRIASFLLEREYRLRIEGHTDDRPIHTSRFSDNWELSTARAAEVVRLLIVRYGFPPDRLSAAGFAQYHPIDSNGSAENRAHNRRVDVVILRGRAPDHSSSVRATHPARYLPLGTAPITDSTPPGH